MTVGRESGCGPGGGKVAIRRLAWPMLVAVVWCVVAVTVFPLRTAFRIGADEAFEFTKGRLYGDGHRLYSEVWNDQPPLHTMLLGTLFRWIGPTALAGRLLTVLFTAGLLVSFFALVERREGPGTAWVATLFLFVLPPFLELGLSCMLEMPAFALGMMATFFWVRAWERGGWGDFAGAGILAGAACMTKLTAGLLLPGMVLEALRLARDRWREVRGRVVWWMVGWLAGLAAVVGLLWVLHPAMTMTQLLGVHFAGRTREMAGMGGGMSFSWMTFWFLGYAVVPALLGVGLRWARGCSGTVLLPFTWLATVTVAHLVNRPYWAFYQLHFVFPLAWLAAVGLKDVAGLAWSALAGGRSGVAVVRSLGWTALLAGLLALAGVHGGWALVRQVHELRSVAGVEEMYMVGTLRSYGDRIRWAYSDDAMYVFHAGYKVPPELGVLSFKRRHGAGFGGSEVLAVLERYEPEALILPPYEDYSPAWREFLRRYRVVDADERMALFVVRGLAGGESGPADGGGVSGSAAGSRD